MPLCCLDEAARIDDREEAPRKVEDGQLVVGLLPGRYLPLSVDEEGARERRGQIGSGLDQAVVQAAGAGCGGRT